MPGRVFTIKHTVYFNETNAMGGVVYFSNFIKWQGEVREAFFTETVPEWKMLMEQVRVGKLNMITVEEHSRFVDHAYFGDQIFIKIYAVDLQKLSFRIIFEMSKNESDKIIYSGWQKLAFHNEKGQLMPIPDFLFKSVIEYSPVEEVEKYRSIYLNKISSVVDH